MSVAQGRSAQDDLAQPVCWGPKQPEWSCRCGYSRNWASRIICFQCSDRAPTQVYRAALQNHELRPHGDNPRPRGARVVPAPREPRSRSATSPWQQDTQKRKIDQAIALYHTRFVAALGESCPDQLRSTLPEQPADDKTQSQADPVAQAKKWRHELTQNENSIQASETKLADLQAGIAQRRQRNEELRELLAKHAIDICLQDAIDIESVPAALSQEALDLNNRRDTIAKLETEFRKDLANFEKKKVAPAPPVPVVSPTPAGSARASQAEDEEFDFNDVDPDSLDTIMQDIVSLGVGVGTGDSVELAAAERRKRCQEILAKSLKPTGSKGDGVRRKLTKKPG